MAEATTNWNDSIKTLGDQIVGLSLLQAKELSDYLKEEHGLEAAAGGAVMMAGPAAGGEAAAAAEPTEFNVVLTNAGAKKINVIKEVRGATGLGLKKLRNLLTAHQAPSRKHFLRKKLRSSRLKLKLPAVRSNSKLELNSFVSMNRAVKNKCSVLLTQATFSGH